MTTEMGDEAGATREQQGIWIRGLFMLLFVVIYGVAEAVVVAVAVVQFGSIVLSDERNARLEQFGASLSEFIGDVIRFWTFVSEEKPFPFSEWPKGRVESKASAS